MSPARKPLRRGELVSTSFEGQVDTHLPAVTGDGYATLCGLDGGAGGAGDDPELSNDFDGAQFAVPNPPRARVTCPDCLEIWALCRRVPPALMRLD